MASVDLDKIPIPEVPPEATQRLRTDYDILSQLPGVAVAGARGVAAGTLGLPVNLANIPGTISHLVGGPEIPRIPGGSDWWNEQLTRLGIREPGSGPERIAETVGEFAGPGIVPRVAEGVMGRSSALLDKLRPFLTAGRGQDVAMGTAAGVGGEVGAQMDPRGQTGRALGQIGGPLALAAGHGALSRSLPWLGKEIRLDQDVTAATQALQQAQEALQTQKAGAADRVQAALDHARDVLARQEAQVAGVQMGAVTPATAALTAATRRAETDLAQARSATQTAERSQTQAFAPLESTVTGGVGTGLPGEKAAGAGTKASVEAAAAARQADITQGYTTLRNDIGPALERTKMATAAQKEVLPLFQSLKKTHGAMFDAIEKTIGDETLPMQRLGGTIERLREETQRTGQPMPRGATAMGQTASGAAEDPGVQHLVELQQAVLADPKLTAAQRQAATQAIADLERGQTAEVPFWLARRMESALGEMQRGARPVGTQLQGRARQMESAVWEDMNDFLQNHPAQSKELQHAKDTWKDFLHTYNYSANRLLLDRSAKANPAQWFDALLGSGTRAVDDLTLAKKVLEPQTWQTLKASLLQHLYDQAGRGTGVESVEQLQGVAKNLQRNGKIDVLLNPEEKARFLGLVQDISAAQKGPASKLNKALANRTPDEVSSYVFQPGKAGQTEQYKSITDTATFDTQVKAWLGSLLEKAPGMSPEQRYAALEPLARRNAGNPSQLDLMLEQYPGMSDHLTQMVEAYRQSKQAVPGLKDQEAAAKARLKGPTAAPDIQQAEAAVAQAEQRLAWVQDQLATAKTTTAEATRGTKDANTAALKPYQAEVDAAQKTLREAKAARGTDTEEGVSHAFGRVHQGGLVVRTSLGSAGFIEFLVGIHQQKPLAIAAGLAGMGVGFGFSRYARTAAGRRAIREGLPTRWSPAAARFAASVVGSPPPSPEGTQP